MALALLTGLALAGCGTTEGTSTEQNRSTGQRSSSTQSSTNTSQRPLEVVVMPDLIGIGVYEAQCSLAKLGLGWSIDRRKPGRKPEANCSTIDRAAPVPNPAVTAQMPRPGEKLRSDGVIGLMTACSNQRAPQNGPYCLPGLPGSP